MDCLLTKAIINPSEIKHETEKNFYVLESMGYEVVNKNIEIWTDEADDRHFKQKLIQKNEKIIVIAPGGSHSRKQWEPKNYAELVSKISGNNKNVKFIVLGSEAERNLGEIIRENTVYQHIINLCGQTSLRQAGSICKIASAYIGSDTGLMHIAAAVGVPILSPNCCADSVERTPYTVPERIKPWRTLSVVITPKEPIGECKNVISAYGCIAEQAHCINQISVNDMYAGWEKLNLMIEESKKVDKKREDIKTNKKINKEVFINEPDGGQSLLRDCPRGGVCSLSSLFKRKIRVTIINAFGRANLLLPFLELNHMDIVSIVAPLTEENISVAKQVNAHFIDLADIEECTDFYSECYLVIGITLTAEEIINVLKKKGVNKNLIVNCSMFGLERNDIFAYLNIVKFITTTKQKVDFLATGISYAEYGIDLPALEPHIGFNLAIGSQDLFYSYKIVEHILMYKKTFKYILIGIAPYSFEYNASLSKQNFRFF